MIPVRSYKQHTALLDVYMVDFISVYKMCAEERHKVLQLKYKKPENNRRYKVFISLWWYLEKPLGCRRWCRDSLCLCYQADTEKKKLLMQGRRVWVKGIVWHVFGKCPCLPSEPESSVLSLCIQSKDRSAQHSDRKQEELLEDPKLNSSVDLLFWIWQQTSMFQKKLNCFSIMYCLCCWK